MIKALKNIFLALLVFTLVIPLTSLAMTETAQADAMSSITFVNNPAGSGYYPGSVASAKTGWRCYVATEEGVVRSKIIDFEYGNLPTPGNTFFSTTTRLGGNASGRSHNPPWAPPLINGASNAGAVKAKLKSKTGKNGQPFVVDVIETYFGAAVAKEFIQEQEYFVLEPIYWGYMYRGLQRSSVQIYGTSQFWSRCQIFFGYPAYGDSIQKSWVNQKMGQAFKLDANKDGLFGLSYYANGGAYTNTEGVFGNGLGIGVLWAGDLDETEELQTTCDESQQPTEHRAPQESSGSYRIIKFYEEQESDGAIQPLVNYTRKGVTNKIQVENEADWELIKWDKSTNYYGKKGSGLENEILNALSSYDEVVGACGSTGGGAGTSLVTLTEKVDTTLYVRLRRKEGAPREQEMHIRESELTRAFKYDDISVFQKEIKIAYPNLWHECDEVISKTRDPETNVEAVTYCDGYTKIKEEEFEYFLKNKLEEEYKKVLATTEPFKMQSKSFKTTRKGNIHEGDETIAMNQFKIKFVLWRGLDKCTFAQYQSNSGDIIGLFNDGFEDDLNRMVSAHGRLKKKYETELKLSMVLDTGKGDIKSIAEWTCDHHEDIEVDSYEDPAAESAGKVYVDVYSGTGRDVGDLTQQGRILNLPFVEDLAAFNGIMVNDGTPIKFYPYIRMTYQYPTDAGTHNKHDADVLSEYERSFIGNSYAGIGYMNPGSNRELKIWSPQWSTHKLSTKWANGRLNTVLPGGAIIELTTPKGAGGTGAASPQTLYIETYHVVVDDKAREVANAAGDLGDSYTEAKAVQEHNDYVDSVKKTIDGYRAVQWISTDNADKSENVWERSDALAITEAGQGLTDAYDSKSASPDAKYYFKPMETYGSGDKKANQGDLDYEDKGTTRTVYEIKSDYRGNVTITGGGGATINKKQDERVLSGELALMNKKTLAVSNFLRAIERNAGNDKTAAWATGDGRWYNEAYGPFKVIRQVTVLEVGLKYEWRRSSVLDPRLCPKTSDMGDLFSKAYTSQYRISKYSDSPDAGGDFYMGSFRDNNVSLLQIEDIYNSDIFWIPNVNVQDVH